MKMIKGVTFLFASLLAMSSATAGIIYDEELVQQSVGKFDYASWTHELEGFTPGTAVSGSLWIDFGQEGRRTEFASIKVGDLDFEDDRLLFRSNDDLFGDLGDNSIEIVNTTSALQVSVFNTGVTRFANFFGFPFPIFNGDSFWIEKSVLTINTTGEFEPSGGEMPQPELPPISSVAEPSTLALLAAGMIGLVLIRRKAG